MNLVVRCCRPLIVCLLSLLSGCASMRSDYEAPKIDVVAIEKLETDTEALAFTVRLRITNPNPEPIRLEGLYYELNLEGLDVVNGTARDLPEIDGYSSETV
ncbi:MAG: hypothetical protein ACOC4K_01650, partial [Verrucomicrobiota bacterium]